MPTNKIHPSRTMLAHEYIYARSSARARAHETNASEGERPSMYLVAECMCAQFRRWICFYGRGECVAKREQTEEPQDRNETNRLFNSKHAYTTSTIVRLLVGRSALLGEECIHTSTELYVRVRALRAYAFLYSFFLFIFSSRFWVVRSLFCIHFSSLKTDIDGYERKTVQDKTPKSEKRERKKKPKIIHDLAKELVFDFKYIFLWIYLFFGFG